jgi:uncharacterized Zn-finger protein
MAQPRDTTDGLRDTNGLVKNESSDLQDTLLTCDYCGQTSTEKAELICHISSVHSLDLGSPDIAVGSEPIIETKYKVQDSIIVDCVDKGQNGHSHQKLNLGNIKHVGAKQLLPRSVCGSVLKRQSDVCKHVKKYRLQDSVCTAVQVHHDNSGVASDNLLIAASVNDNMHVDRGLIEVKGDSEDCVRDANKKSSHVKCGKTKGCSCNLCGRLLITKYDLLRHLKTHSKKLASFVSSGVKCQNFDTAGNIKEIVSGVKSREGSHFELGETENVHGFPCHVCGRILTRKFDLCRHLKTHSRKPNIFDGLFDLASPGVASSTDISSGNFDPGDGLVSTLQEVGNGSVCGEHLTGNSFNSEEKNGFPCNICGKILTRKFDFCRHLTTHAKKRYSPHEGLSNARSALVTDVNSSSSDEVLLGSSEGKKSTFGICTVQKFSCNICSKSYTRKFDLKRHAKQHSIEDIGKIVQLKNSIDHKSVSGAKVIIEGRTLYKCEHCAKYLMTRYSYVRHLRIHTGEKPCTCHVCGKQFRTSALLNRHVRDVHEGIKEHPCDFCGRKFANKRAVVEHRRVHTGERPCVCHLCGKAFKTKASLYVHNLFHTDVFPHHCTHCNKAFRRRHQLNIHLLLHTGEKPHCCQICGKCFRLRKSLKRHVLTHSNEKPFECLVCGQLFAQERYLKNHGKTHGIQISDKVPPLDSLLPASST